MTQEPAADALRQLAVEGYFGRVMARDMEGLLGNIAADAAMIIPPLGIEFAGREAIQQHFDEFLESYDDIRIDEFQTTADPATNSVAVRFHIGLTSADDGTQQHLRNCNFFDVNDDGLIQRITIYMSAAPATGFTAGAQHYGEA